MEIQVFNQKVQDVINDDKCIEIVLLAIIERYHSQVNYHLDNISDYNYKEVMEIVDLDKYMIKKLEECIKLNQKMQNKQ